MLTSLDSDDVVSHGNIEPSDKPFPNHGPDQSDAKVWEILSYVKVSPMFLEDHQDGNDSLFNNSTGGEGDGVSSAGPVFQIVVVVFACILIIVTVVGNTLVILAVLTTKKLRTITNCFVTSLAVADWLVGTFVMPPAVYMNLVGSWQLGDFLCDIWISMDVLLCTASILSLCAISVDRYLAVTRPLRYSRRRRSKRLALFMILAVWIFAVAITSPPMFGWYEIEKKDCRYNQNPGYVIFSAMGSFFIPMGVMLYVYVRISYVIARRHKKLSSAAVEEPKKYSRASVKSDSEIPESLTESRSHQNDSSDICDYEQSQHSRRNDEAKCSGDVPIKQYCFNNNKRSSHRRSYRGILKFQIEDDGRRVSMKKSTTVTFENSRMSRTSIKSKTKGSQYQNNRVTSLCRETKTAQTLSIVMGGFIACWLPFFISYLITPFVSQTYLNQIPMSFLTWLGWFNSAINPFIYAFYSPDFRLAFWRLTFKCCFENNRRNNFAMQGK